MRNLSHYKTHPFSFYQSIVSRKHKPGKPILMAIEPQMRQEYDEFINLDIQGNLHLLPELTLTEDEKQHLLECYSYKKTKDIRDSVMGRGHGRRDPTCPYCTIGKYETMDHFLPKELYPAHSVNHLNLIPCCSTCNGYKGTLTKEGNNRLFLNLYCDILPEVQYLFVNFDFSAGSVPSVEFQVMNVNGIDPMLFSIIANHYDKLHLPERFSEEAFDIMLALNVLILANKRKSSDEEIKLLIKEVCDAERAYYGYNYWKSILKQSCIDDTRMYNLLSTTQILNLP